MSLLTILLSVITCSQLTMRDGLSQNSVFSITQDSQRNMWFATYDGINRYDGYNFTLYRPERDPNFTQQEGADQKVYADSKGNIWAYDGGVSRYSHREDKFISLHDKVSGVVTSFMEIPGDKILVAVDGKIVQLDINNGDLLNCDPLCPDERVSVMDCAYGLLAVATMSGAVCLYDAEDLSFIKKINICPGLSIRNIQFASQGELWASRSGHLVKYDINRSTLRNYYNNTSFQTSPSSIICKDANGTIFASAEKNIYAYDAASDDFILHSTLIDNPIATKCLYHDVDGGIWLGSYYRGVYYCPLEKNSFENIPLGAITNDLQVSCIGESTDGKIWIYVWGMGIYIYDRSENKISHLDFDPDPNGSGIKKIFFSQDGKTVWFGLNAGLSEFNLKTGKHIKYLGKNYPRAVYSILQADDNRLWLGTLSGVYLFDISTRQATKIPSSDNLFVYKLYEDTDGFLWVAAESGLYKSLIKRGADGTIGVDGFFRVTDAKDVHDIIQSGDRLVVAARNGLYVRNAPGTWQHYDQSSGLSSSFINGVEIDSRNILWVATEYGLNSFDASKGDFSRYFKDEGLSVDYFTKNAHCKSSDGSLYFGGIGGLVRVNESGSPTMHVSADPCITDFYVNGVQRSFEDNKLSYVENSVSFRFSVSNYSSRHKNLFRYRLCGVDKDWRITENPYSDVYGALRPGEYRFELESYNVSGQRCVEHAEFAFKITPPWWATIAAIITYVIIVLALIAAGILRMYAVNKRKMNAEIERITALSQADIDRLTILHYTVDPVSPEDAAFVLKVVRLVEDKVADENYGVEQLADDLCMSRSNLYLRVKKLTGGSALQLVNKIRLEKACQLLRDTELSIADVATASGFSSTAYFCTFFKREKGITPNAWRQL